jgi:hypothetical protein
MMSTARIITKLYQFIYTENEVLRVTPVQIEGMQADKVAHRMKKFITIFTLAFVAACASYRDPGCQSDDKSEHCEELRRGKLKKPPPPGYYGPAKPPSEDWRMRNPLKKP